MPSKQMKAGLTTLIANEMNFKWKKIKESLKMIKDISILDFGRAIQHLNINNKFNEHL
jgi:hypothetical protein